MSLALMNKAQGKCFVSKINLVMYPFVFVFIRPGPFKGI